MPTISPFSTYKVILQSNAHKTLKNIAKQERIKIINKLDLLISNPETLNIKKLQGFKDLYRIKSNDYRIIYTPNHDTKTLLVAIIGHRKDVYKIIKNLSIFSQNIFN